MWNSSVDELESCPNLQSEEALLHTTENGGHICRCYESLACACIEECPCLDGAVPLSIPERGKTREEASFRELVSSAPEIGLTPIQFLRILREKVGLLFGEAAFDWWRGIKPAELARVVILRAIEGLLRQHNVVPTVSLPAARFS